MTPQNAASHMGLFCLPMSHKRTPGLYIYSWGLKYGLKFTAADVDRVIGAWQGNYVILTSSQPMNKSRLNDILNDETTTQRQYIHILYGVLKYIDTLHQRNMVQEDMTTNEIYVYRQRKVHEYISRYRINCEFQYPTYLHTNRL